MSAARGGLSARLRRQAIDSVRSSRLFPLGTPNKKADQHRMGAALDSEIIVFFPTTLDSVYQLRSWYRALQALHARHPLTIVFRDSRTASIARGESGLDCLTIGTYGQLDEILALSNVKMALYINHDPLNFECLRFASLIHVYIGHGDSDKGVSVSNQVKAYDYSFVAGRAAVERAEIELMRFDAVGRMKLVGQPLGSEPPTAAPDPQGRSTVLYAPTWESSQPSLSYGSLQQMGTAIVRALSAEHRVIYRPHPLNGVIDADYGRADAEVRALADRVDADVPIERSFVDADLLICDVSAVSLQWLPTDKPLIITEPRVEYTPSALMAATTLLRATDDIAGAVREELATDPHRGERNRIAEHYLSGIDYVAAVDRFVDACTELIVQRDRDWAEHRSRGAVGP